MNKQSDFIQEFIRKFISKDIPSKLIYKNNYVAENCNKREDYMFEDVIVWDPQILQEKLLSVCPVCSEKSRLLQPVLWKYGKKDYEVLRFVYGIHNDVLLVRRAYMCLRKHQFIAHDTGILKQSRNPIEEPSLLFNKTAITRDLHRFFLVHVNFGLSSHDILTLWYQPQCDEYRSRKLQLEKRYLISAEDKLVM